MYVSNLYNVLYIYCSLLYNSIYFRDRPVDFILLCSFSKNNKMILIIIHIYICKSLSSCISCIFLILLVFRAFGDFTGFFSTQGISENFVHTFFKIY